MVNRTCNKTTKFIMSTLVLPIKTFKIKHMKNLLLIALLNLSLISFSQNWTYTYNESTRPSAGYSAIQTSDGGFVACGTIDSSISLQNIESNSNIIVVKTDINGNFLWDFSYGSYYKDRATHIEQTSDGGFIICGFINHAVGINPGQFALLIKIDANGNFLWSKEYENNSKANCVKETSDGGFIFCGVASNNVDLDDIYLVKTNSMGDETWSKKFDGISNNIFFPGNNGIQTGNYVIETNDGGFVVCGNEYISNSSGYNDIYIVKTNSNGNEIWSKTYGGLYNETANAIKQTNDGGYILIGSSEGTGNFYSDIYMLKLNSLGNLTWSNFFGTAQGVDKGADVIQTSDNGFAICGSMSNNICLIKTDLNGQQIWQNIYYINDGIQGKSIISTSDGKFLLCGTSNIVDSGSQYYNSKLTLLNVNPSYNLLLNETNESEFEIYPNPTSNLITFEVTEELINQKYSIYDNSGRIIKQDIVQKIKEQIDISAFSNGIYYLKIEKKNIQKMIIKQ